MRLLVLGGTHHVGRAVVEAALAAGDDVTTLTTGRSGPPASGAHARYADRADASALHDALGDEQWDVVVDTWSGAPAVVRTSAILLRCRVARYCYVSSRSVYADPLPLGADESAAVVDGDPCSTDDGDYAAAKRGGELAALDAFGDRALLARAGLIIGPYERIGRLPYWLLRMARGGQVPCPGPHDRPLQLIDARDLADWTLAGGAAGVTGAVNTVSRPGHATIGSLLEECARVTGGSAELVWASPEAVERSGVEPWTQLPLWLPPDHEAAGLHDSDVRRALATGLSPRPIADTVGDTWAWIQAEGEPPAAPGIGMSAGSEARLLVEALADRREGRPGNR